jgi:hypothetical protein
MYVLTPEKLLAKVRFDGWDILTRKTFLDLFGTLIRRNILYHTRHYFGATHLRALADYLTALQSDQVSRIAGGISGEILGIASDTWQDVLIRVWRPENNLVDQWCHYKEGKVQAGEPFRDFEPYLKGTVQNTFWGHLRSRKHRLDPQGNLDELEERLVDTNQAAHQIPSENEAALYWDRLLRCQRPDPSCIEEDLVRLRQEPETVLIWACARLKHTLYRKRKESSLENLLAFMVFFCSQAGPQRSSDHPLRLDELNYERVAGHYFRWEEDVCRRIFRKRIRKDRPMKQIQSIILESPYRALVQEETP